MMAATHPHLLTSEQVAAKFQLSKAWLERQRWLGEGPAFIRFGRAVRYDPAAISAYLQAHTVSGLEGGAA